MPCLSVTVDAAHPWQVPPRRTSSTPDATLVDELTELLAAVETDMTLFYRHLSDVPLSAEDDATRLAPLEVAFYDAASVGAEHRARLAGWLRRYASRVREDGGADGARKQRMDRANPKFILRNYVAQLAIDAAERGDGSVVLELLEVLKRPLLR